MLSALSFGSYEHSIIDVPPSNRRPVACHPDLGRGNDACNRESRLAPCGVASIHSPAFLCLLHFYWAAAVRFWLSNIFLCERSRRGNGSGSRFLWFARRVLDPSADRRGVHFRCPAVPHKLVLSRWLSRD